VTIADPIKSLNRKENDDCDDCDDKIHTLYRAGGKTYQKADNGHKPNGDQPPDTTSNGNLPQPNHERRNRGHL
jgi:hypothetical protein